MQPRSDERMMVRDLLVDAEKRKVVDLRLAFGSYVAPDASSNAYGYRTLTYNLFTYMREAGCSFEASAPDVLHLVPCGWFDPVPGKRNWLFTMIENEYLGDKAVEMLCRADHVLVPSEWNAAIYRKRLPTDKPITVVPLGVDERFTFIERDYPENGYPFRFLWVGAMNPRKGWNELLWGWKGAGFTDFGGMELYLKTTYYQVEGSVRRIGNIIMDSRDVPVEELAKIYHSAHAFVLPTRGEAFALTLAEAMRTGLPCIAPMNGGHMDYFGRDVGYEVECFEAMGQLIPGDGEPDVIVKVKFPDVGDLLRQILYVSSHYEEAMWKGRLAAHRVEGMTWKGAAEKLMSLIGSVQEREDHEDGSAYS